MASNMITSEQAMAFVRVYKRPRITTTIDWVDLLGKITDLEADFSYRWSYESVFLTYNAYCFGIEQACREKNIRINRSWAVRRQRDADHFRYVFGNPAHSSSENDENLDPHDFIN